MADDRCRPLQSPSSCGRGKRRQSENEPHTRGLTMDAHGMPVRALITEGTAADCTQAIALIDGFTAENFLADKGYDTDTIRKPGDVARH